MRFKVFKLYFRRRVRHSQQQVEDFGLQAEASLERHFFRRIANFGNVWRFISGWLVLICILIAGLVVQLVNLGNHYQTLQPAAGGTFTEGIVGSFTNANPLFATSEADKTIASLVFAGLLHYDDQNHLVGDLASSWSVDDKGLVYTVHLKPNLKWQDGKSITADDVVFTYQAIQNPDAQSPLASSWQGIAVAKTSKDTVTFTLPSPLSSFTQTLTNGIVPAHSLAGLPPTEWRSADFDTIHPVGAGPFSWGALQVKNNTQDNAEVLVALKPFAGYQGGMPKLSSMVIHTFTNQSTLLKNFQNQQLTAIAVPSLPSGIETNTLQQYNFIETAANMVFFNMNNSVLADKQVRQALVAATNVPRILKQLGYPTRAVREPLLKGQLAYDAAYAQAAYNPTAAGQLLDQAGWLKNKQGIREKGGKVLEFSLDASRSPEFTKVSGLLQQDWQVLGLKVDVQVQESQDFQDTLNAHTYDALLDGISIGVDPDVFVYWDSSQTDPRSTRLNLSFYKSSTADAALEAGRTRLDPALRIIKYRPFLQAWQQDAPALGLYQPRYLYLSHQQIYGLDGHVINTPTDRFSNVQNWEIRTAKVTN